MKTSAAIRRFMNSQGHNPDMTYAPVKVQEIKEFKNACTPEEYADLGKQACTLLGETWEA